MVSKAREDLPAPEGPVTTVTARCGTRQSIPFRLWVRARSIRMAGCLGLGIGSRRRSGSDGADHHNAGGGRAFPRGAAERYRGPEGLDPGLEEWHRGPEGPDPGLDEQDCGPEGPDRGPE